MKVQLTGIEAWVFFICIGVTFSLIAITGGLVIINEVWMWLLRRFLVGCKSYRYFVEYIFHREEIKRWLDKKVFEDEDKIDEP